MKLFKTLLLGLIAYQAAFCQVKDTVQHVNQERRNSKAQEQKPYVIMISMDGFRYDYISKYNAVHLKELSDKGVRATDMIPSFPSLTFPNHYTMVTGLYPSHHGLVQNSFYDRNLKAHYSYKSKTAIEGRWYGGTPLWVLAEKQKMVTASFYWVGSEAEIQHTYPTYFYRYNEDIDIHDRINAVVDWLKQPAERRPHLITFYFPEVDHQSHKYGPDSKETAAAVRLLDSAIYELTKAVKTTGVPVNYVVVSDHGMTRIDTEHAVPTPEIALDTTQFIREDEGVLIHLYAKKASFIKPAYEELKASAKEYDVYLRDNMPDYLHYGTKDDWHNRIGDIILIPRWPKSFNTNNKKMSPGAHGYDPYKVKDMHAIFLAWGPDFKRNLVIPAFKNVDIYPMVTQLLGLTETEKVDGTKELAKRILIKKKK